jgi:hypothetical protein
MKYTALRSPSSLFRCWYIYVEGKGYALSIVKDNGESWENMITAYSSKNQSLLAEKVGHGNCHNADPAPIT